LVLKRSREERGPGGDHATPAARAPRHASPVSNGKPPEQRLDIRLLQLLGVTVARCYHRTTVTASQRLLRDGPAILVCNHISGLDPVMIQSVCARSIVWMMAREYYEIPMLKWFFRTINAIPVDRTGRDLTATRAALRALGDGRVLGVFPEGKIEKTPDLIPFQTGVAMMAIKTGVPVYPAYLNGTQRGMSMVRAFLTPSEATITFGPPVQFPRGSTSKEALDTATRTIQQAVEKLKIEQEGAAPRQFRTAQTIAAS
jgi:1-acyl-sn-glycerol-3-phosphate acyltransferase